MSMNYDEIESAYKKLLEDMRVTPGISVFPCPHCNQLIAVGDGEIRAVQPEELP